MAKLSLMAMAAARAQYEDECHERKTHRKDTLAHLDTLNLRAVDEFKRQQLGLPTPDVDLWSELAKHRKDSKSGVTGPLIRKALRAFLEKEQNGMCCYCQRPLVNIAHAKPIEHILPRANFVQYTFHFWNLAVACFDCNQIKLDDIWADAAKHDLELYPEQDTFTEMFHPRFHSFSEHVRFIRLHTNEHIVSIYVGITEQGKSLCLKLLKKLSAREIVLNSNPKFKAAMNVINDHAAMKDGDIAPELVAFHKALAKSTSQLMKDFG